MRRVRSRRHGLVRRFAFAPRPPVEQFFRLAHVCSSSRNGRRPSDSGSARSRFRLENARSTWCFADEIRNRGVSLGDGRITRLARGERASVIRVHLPVVPRDRVDDALRDLCPARTVEVDDGNPCLAAGESGKLFAERLRVERGHEGPSLGAGL